MFNLVPYYSKKWKPCPLNVKGVEGISQSRCIKISLIILKKAEFSCSQHKNGQETLSVFMLFINAYHKLLIRNFIKRGFPPGKAPLAKEYVSPSSSTVYTERVKVLLVSG